MSDLDRGNPPSVASVDEHLRQQLSRAHRARWWTVVILALVIITAMSAGGWIIVRDNNRLGAGCSFYRAIGTSPITTVPPARQPTKLGITIVADSRIAYTREGCGQLPPPSRDLRHWTAFYHIPLPR